MPLRGTWYVIQQSIPAPAWVRWPEQQRFCCCCSIRTGASLIGWFNFLFNSFYAGMLILAMTQLRNMLDERLDLPTEFSDTRPDPDEFEGSVNIPSQENDSVIVPALDPKLRDYITNMIDETLPMMYKSIAIPAIMIIFSVLWLITVEGRTISLVRLFGRAFILAIIIQLLLQLGLLAYVDIESRNVSGQGISWIVWVVFVFYALLNLYFIPVLSEYIKRRIKENNQGLEQGLLTSEMYPKSRVAEEYIEDAFTLDGDNDVVRFQASIDDGNLRDDRAQEINDDYQPI
ncbi:uncharacterized protein LOC120343178 isoform X1 [Styela clava]|uniref:uncharacterized protein LOC120343178 isoform X1 n=1 Tax=Styela clava TaxID=7725 RepID=UPI00193ACF51|nr:uncharacterized protein LOC120343178 isoform X1 [Styela clava]